MTKALEKIFSVKNEYKNFIKYKVISICGIKIKKRCKNPSQIKNIEKFLLEQGVNNVKLHIGCGRKYKKGWVNIDNNSYGNIDKLDLNYDLRNPLPFPDNWADFIFNEHFLEHLTAEEGAIFIKECVRVLKPGGVLRIAMPNLENMIKKFYCNENWKEDNAEIFRQYKLDFIKTKAEYLNINFRRWGHQWLYDKEELSRRLKEVGCDNFYFCEVFKSNYPELNDIETRKSSTLVVEVIKNR